MLGCVFGGWHQTFMREVCVQGRCFWIREGFASEKVQLPKEEKKKGLGVGRWNGCGGGMGVECSVVGWRRGLMTLRTVEEGSVAVTDERP